MITTLTTLNLNFFILLFFEYRISLFHIIYNSPVLDHDIYKKLKTSVVSVVTFIK